MNENTGKVVYINKIICKEPYIHLSWRLRWMFIVLCTLCQVRGCGDRTEISISDLELAYETGFCLRSVKKYKKEMKEYMSDLIGISVKSGITHYKIFDEWPEESEIHDENAKFFC